MSHHNCPADSLGYLPDGVVCSICWSIAAERAKADRTRLLLGEGRSNEDFIEPEPVFVPTGSLK